MEADITAIEEILNQYSDSCNSGDFDLWMSLWADTVYKCRQVLLLESGKSRYEKEWGPCSMG
jgi:hypothetical protein